MITILMATFNGERFIDEQLSSIFSQTFKDYTVVISDDGSTDNTVAIIEKWKVKFPEKITLINKEKNSGTAKINFFDMMLEYKLGYIMLCDQDDVWLTTKVEKTLDKMKEMEEKYGKNTPIVVHTDLQVVDSDLNVTNLSYEKSANANFTRTKLNQIIVQNVVAGCTTMYNQALAQYLDHMPTFFVMHDWWVALIAASFGRIDHVSEGLILYRQHDDNEVGAVSAKSLKYQINRFINNHEVKETLNQTYLQAEAFLHEFEYMLPESHKKLLAEYASIPSKSKIKRIETICRLGTIKNGLTRKIANFIFV